MRPPHSVFLKYKYCLNPSDRYYQYSQRLNFCIMRRFCFLLLYRGKTESLTHVKLLIFLYSLKIWKPRSFLIHLGGIERNHRHEPNSSLLLKGSSNFDIAFEIAFANLPEVKLLQLWPNSLSSQEVNLL